MWICPKCNESIEDKVTSCWKCAGAAAPPESQPAKRPRPLELFELIFLVIAAMPGILFFTGGRVQNLKQGLFRIALFLVGATGYIAIKIYQRSTTRPK